MPLPALADTAAQYDAWLRDAALPLWASAGYDSIAGGFREALDAQGGPVAGAVRLRVQARQTWVYAQAGRTGWHGPWRERVGGGLQALLTRYRREAGGFRAAVAHDGRVGDDAVALYDQAFVLLAFAGATAVGEPAEGLAAAARELLAETILPLRHAGGFREPVGRPFQANAQMHLLEAALAWQALDPDGPWTEIAGGIVALALNRFIADGALREFFDEAWRPAPPPDGRRVEPGHQFEWAWLLERWGLANGDAQARRAATSLFGVGERGVDPVRHVAVDALTDDLAALEPSARLWPQSERLRAAATLARRRDADQGLYVASALDAARGLWPYLETPVPGAWRDRMEASGALPVGPAPASSFYHLVGAILALTDRDAPQGADDLPHAT